MHVSRLHSQTDSHSVSKTYQQTHMNAPGIFHVCGPFGSRDGNAHEGILSDGYLSVAGGRHASIGGAYAKEETDGNKAYARAHCRRRCRYHLVSSACLLYEGVIEIYKKTCSGPLFRYTRSQYFRVCVFVMYFYPCLSSHQKSYGDP